MYRPAERNCITLCPARANCAQRDSVFGFCSSPRSGCPSNTKSTSRKRFRGVSRTVNVFPSNSTSAAPSTSACRQTFTITSSNVMTTPLATSDTNFSHIQKSSTSSESPSTIILVLLSKPRIVDDSPSQCTLPPRKRFCKTSHRQRTLTSLAIFPRTSRSSTTRKLLSRALRKTPNQYVQWVNESFAVFDKTTGVIATGFPKTGNTLWTGFGGGCEANNDGDPIAQYDKAANRWGLTQFSVSTTPYLQCVAVSTTSDATGTYNRYSFSYGNVQFPDYPKLGVLPDCYYN